ncbi:unnamed protein product [Rhizophagus irregularis]|nr:unnamed protein product [Rhizophagus irregularis]
MDSLRLYRAFYIKFKRQILLKIDICAFGTTSVQSSFPKLITRNDGSLRLYRNFTSNLSATEFQFPTLATNTFEDRFM